VKRTIKYENGDEYIGEMLGDIREGKGILISSKGDIYVGNW